MGYYVKNRVLQSGSTSVVMPVGTSTNRPTEPVAGMTRYNSVLSLLEFYNGAAWTTLSTPVTVSYSTQTFTGTGVQVNFTMSVAPTTAAQILVYVNGVYQTAPTNYTTSGTTLTFTSAPPNGIGITVVYTST